MEDTEIGVGPHEKPWPDDSRYDVELFENGDRRNVLDRYRYWTVEAIKADLDNSRTKLHVAIENWQHDLNIGTIVRAANAFNVDTVHIIGKKHWNRRGAMVTDRYMNIVQYENVADFAQMMKDDGRQIIVIDIIPGAKKLSDSMLPENSVLVFGGEGPGVSSEMKLAADEIIMIEQFGSTRSVNVGVAAGIAMYVWMQQNILNRANVD